MREMPTYTIKILNKSFQVGCSDAEKNQLLEAADFLDKKMRDSQRSGGLVGIEKVAIMTALNISNELIKLQKELAQLKSQEKNVGEVDKQIQFIQNKVSDALDKHKLLTSPV